MDNNKTTYSYEQVRELLDLQRLSVVEQINSLNNSIDKLHNQITELTKKPFNVEVELEVEVNDDEETNVIEKFQQDIREIIEDGETAKGKLFDEILQKMLNI
tara:strand:+ start:29 stop:334 length:306 start_codon:yes stop_codon:yes gene_type:complete